MVSTRELIHAPRKQFAPNLEWSLIAGLLGPNMPFYNAKDGKDAVSWMLSQFSSCSTRANRGVGTTHQNLLTPDRYLRRERKQERIMGLHSQRD